MTNSNTGYCNAGKRNTGDRNTGSCNTGNCNTGDGNTGNRNTGSYNIGYCNTGDRNTGSCNAGKRNTGDCNTGNWNTGDWNMGDRNTGYFNTTVTKVRIFNKETELNIEDIIFPNFLYKITLTEFIPQEKMTQEEKEINTNYGDVGGYLKTYTYKEAFRKAWDDAELDDKKKLFDLPNWDNEIFKEISGINAEAELNEKKEIIIIDGKKYKLIEN